MGCEFITCGGSTRGGKLFHTQRTTEQGTTIHVCTRTHRCTQHTCVYSTHLYAHTCMHTPANMCIHLHTHTCVHLHTAQKHFTYFRHARTHTRLHLQAFLGENLLEELIQAGDQCSECLWKTMIQPDSGLNHEHIKLCARKQHATHAHTYIHMHTFMILREGSKASEQIKRKTQPNTLLLHLKNTYITCDHPQRWGLLCFTCTLL
jgi:hypothetical protein